MAVLIAFFIAYTVFCVWVILLDGAEKVEGWRSFFLIDTFAPAWTSQEIRFYCAISWISGLVILVVSWASER